MPNRQTSTTHVGTVKTLPDTTPPRFVLDEDINTYPLVGDITETSAAVAVHFDEPATWYWVVTRAAQRYPNVNQVVAGLTGSNVAAIDSGSTFVNASRLLSNMTATGLIPDQQYVAHFVAEDAMETPNRQTAVSRVTFRALCQFVPQVVIQNGPLVITRPSVGAEILAVPQRDGCIGSGIVHTMVVFWEVLSTRSFGAVDNGAFTLSELGQDDVDAVARSTTDARRLRLSSKHLRVGHEYTIRVTSWSRADSRLNATAVTVVRVMPDDLIPVVNDVDYTRAAIFDGINPDTAFVLNATQTVDLEALSYPAAAPMVFAWHCTAVDDGGTCTVGSSSTALDIAPLLSDNNRVLSLPAGTLSAGKPQGLRFTLVVTAGNIAGSVPLHRRSASMNVTLVPSTGVVGPSVRIAVPAASRSYHGVVDPGAALTLQGTTTTANSGTGPAVDTLQWDVPADVLAAFTANGGAGASVLTRSSIVIAAGTFTGGRDYVFTLRATDVNGGVGAAALVVTANSPPHGGHVVVAPTKGLASSTLFTIAGSAWQPFSSRTLPLVYRFGTRPAVAPATGDGRHMLTAFTPANNTRTQLSDDGKATADQNVTLIAFVMVRDAMGTEAMSELDATGALATIELAPTNFNGTRLDLASFVSVELVQAATAAQDVDTALSATEVASKLLTANFHEVGGVPACANAECGQASGHGRCVDGACVCEDGWTGVSCATSTASGGSGTIAGGLSAWSAWSACSVGCGDGTQTRTRSCTNPPPGPGGAACAGDTEEVRSCNIMACLAGAPAEDGGWGPWSDWSACNSSCAAGIVGLFPGWQHRHRECNAPAPSHGGKACAGDATQWQACNTQPCPGAPARCPGSSVAVDPDTLVPVVECSGLGSCRRLPALCREGDPVCRAWCQCTPDGGGVGRACEALSPADRETRDDILSTLLESLGGISKKLDVGNIVEAGQTAASLHTVTQAATEMTRAQRADALAVAVQVIDRLQGQTETHADEVTAALEGVLDAVGSVMDVSVGMLAVSSNEADFEAAVADMAAITPALNDVVARVVATLTSLHKPGMPPLRVDSSAVSVVVANEGSAFATAGGLDMYDAAGSLVASRVGEAAVAAAAANGLNPTSYTVSAVLWSLDPHVASQAAASGFEGFEYVHGRRYGYGYGYGCGCGCGCLSAVLTYVLACALRYSPLAQVTELKFFADGAPLVVQGVSSPVYVHTHLPALANTSATACGYIDTTGAVATWKTDGVGVVGYSTTTSGVGQLTCATTHLTAFGATKSLPPDTKNASPMIQSLSSLLLLVAPNGEVFLFVLAVLLGVFVVMWFLAALVARVRTIRVTLAREALFLKTGIMGRDIKIPPSDKISARTIVNTVVRAFGLRAQHEHSWAGLWAVRCVP